MLSLRGTIPTLPKAILAFNFTWGKDIIKKRERNKKRERARAIENVWCMVGEEIFKERKKDKNVV